MTITEKYQQIENENSYEIMDKEQFKNFMLNLRNGSFTFSKIFIFTKADMNVTGNPYRDRVMKLSSFNIGIQGDYEKIVNNMRDKLGLNDDEDIEEFISQPSWYVPLNGKKSCGIGTHVTKTEQLYLSVYPNDSGTTEVTYFVDGVEATPFELEQIKTFLVKGSKGSKSQGLPEDKQIIIRRPFIESVKYFHADGRKIKVVC